MPNYNTWNNLSSADKVATVQSEWGHLNSGYKQATTTVTYSFLSQDDGRVYQPYVPNGQPVGFEEFSAYEKAFTRLTLDYLEGFLNIDFVEVFDSSGRLGFGKHNMTPGGYADYPGPTKQAVFLTTGYNNDFSGAYGLGTIVHELGHALGLDHTNEYTQGAAERLDRDLDSTMLSIMSYNSAYLLSPYVNGYFSNFSQLDIEALIKIYGLRTSNEGHTYKLNLSGNATHTGSNWDVPIDIPFVLADAGGYDIVDASTLALNNSVSSISFDFDRGLFLDMDQRIEIYDVMTSSWVPISTGELVPHLEIYHGTQIEEFIGTSRSEDVIGNSAGQTVKAGAGNDIVYLKGGNDFVDGGAGSDTAKFSGNSSHYSISLAKSGVANIFDRKGIEGSDGTINVETLDFASGQDISLNLLDGVVNVSADDLTVFIEMYIAYFNRAPDAQGLFYWGTRLDDGMSLQQIAKSFFVQPETVALYPDPNDTSGFVTAVYNNFLGRAPDAEGFQYWVNELDTGSISRDIFMLAIINGAKAATGSPADVDYITGKAKIGSYFSVIKGMSDTDNAKTAMSFYDGSAASLAAAKAKVDDFHSAALDANSGELLINLIGVMDDPFAG